MENQVTQIISYCLGASVFVVFLITIYSVRLDVRRLNIRFDHLDSELREIKKDLAAVARTLDARS